MLPFLPAGMRGDRAELPCAAEEGREMTIQEIENRFCIPAEKLERYEACGLITGIEREDGARDYSEDEISELGLICIFTEAGFTCGEIRQYFALGGTEDGNARQIRMLRKKRGELLERIHCEQKLLDKIDYIICEKRIVRQRIQ